MNTIKSIENTGRQVWLAGLGAYGAGWKYAVEKFDQSFTKSNEMVNELITAGEKVETQLQEKFPKIEKIDIEAKLLSLKSKLGLDIYGSQRIEALSAKVESLTTAVSQLAEATSTEKPKATKKAKATVKKAAKVSPK